MSESEPPTSNTPSNPPSTKAEVNADAKELRRLRSDFDRKGSQVKMFANADASLLGLGTQILSEVLAGVALGWGADALLGTERRWIVVGSITGVVVAMVTLTRTAMRLTARQKLEDARKRAKHPPTA